MNYHVQDGDLVNDELAPSVALLNLTSLYERNALTKTLLNINKTQEEHHKIFPFLIYLYAPLKLTTGVFNSDTKICRREYANEFIACPSAKMSSAAGLCWVFGADRPTDLRRHEANLTLGASVG